MAVLVWLRASERISVNVRALDVFLAAGKRTGARSCSLSSSLKRTSPTARLRPGPRARAISGKRSSSLLEKKMRGRSRNEARSFRARTLSPFPETAAARTMARRRGPARSRVHGQQWFGRRHADRRSLNAYQASAWPRCVGHRPILASRTKKPAADVSARVNQTRLDDVILPVFCPTCQRINRDFKSRDPI